MGVMACSRKRCDNILCETYIQEIGYICDECQNEFKEYLKTLDNYPTKENQIKKELKVFMKTDKDDYAESNEISVDDFFKDYTN